MIVERKRGGGRRAHLQTRYNDINPSHKAFLDFLEELDAQGWDNRQVVDTALAALQQQYKDDPDAPIVAYHHQGAQVTAEMLRLVQSARELYERTAEMMAAFDAGTLTIEQRQAAQAAYDEFVEQESAVVPGASSYAGTIQFSDEEEEDDD